MLGMPYAKMQAPYSAETAVHEKLSDSGITLRVIGLYYRHTMTDTYLNVAYVCLIALDGCAAKTNNMEFLIIYTHAATFYHLTVLYYAHCTVQQLHMRGTNANAPVCFLMLMVT